MGKQREEETSFLLPMMGREGTWAKPMFYLGVSVLGDGMVWGAASVAVLGSGHAQNQGSALCACSEGPGCC